MPWWGWLILTCVILGLTAWVLVARMATRTMREIAPEFDTPAPPRRGPYGK